MVSAEHPRDVVFVVESLPAVPANPHDAHLTELGPVAQGGVGHPEGLADAHGGEVLRSITSIHKDVFAWFALFLFVVCVFDLYFCCVVSARKPTPTSRIVTPITSLTHGPSCHRSTHSSGNASALNCVMC